MSGILVTLLVLAEAHVLIGAAPLSSQDKPDVVILLTDQQRADALGVAGTPGVATPALNRLAREGVRFTHAFCTAPQCSPARAALLTGRYPHRTGVMGNVSEDDPVPAGQSPSLPVELPTLGNCFTAAGYETAYFGKWHLGGSPAAHGFQVVEGDRLDGNVLTEQVQQFLDSRRTRAGTQQRPLLLVVSWIGPHEIYHIAGAEPPDISGSLEVRLPASLGDDLATKPSPQYLYRTEDQGKPFAGADADDWRRYIAFYNERVHEVDGQIGDVVAALQAANPNTLIVFSSDHGDLGGAHGLPFKGPAMYEELVRVPLIISWPGRIRSVVSGALVSHLDILPTVCELAGVGAPSEIDGRSLRPLLSQSPRGCVPWRDAVFAEYYGKQSWRVPIRMVRTRDWKYVRYLGYGEELYDLQRDPYEMSNLVGAAGYDCVRARLAARLDRWIDETRDPFPRLTATDRDGNVLSANK